MGISGDLLQWFKTYLYDRRQRIVLNGVTSDWASVLAGVPQGPFFGLLLFFLIYIDVIVNGITSSIHLLADDTSLYIIVDYPVTAALLLNTDIGTKGNGQRVG